MLTTDLNGPFSIESVKQTSPTHPTFDRAMDRAKELYGSKYRKQFCDKFDLSRQAMNAWRRRGIPTARQVDVAEYLRWTVRQLQGKQEPRATNAAGSWPFQSINQSRYEDLSEGQKMEIESKVLQLMEGFDSTGRPPLQRRR